MSARSQDGPEQRNRVCAITMVQNEAHMLPRWLSYYGGQLGRDNLVVVDDNSTDGSTDGLDCSVLRLPPAPWKESWTEARRGLVNGVAGSLLHVYDAVIFVDVDEFLVPDPDRYDGLLHYISAHPDRDVLAGVGLDVLHDAQAEPDIDPARPVLEQRRLVVLERGMCKPAIKRISRPWMAGGHGIRARFEIDPDLLLLHLKYYDEQHLLRTSQQRHQAFSAQGRGSKASAWALEADEVLSRLRSWVSRDKGRELDTRRLRLPRPRKLAANGFFRVSGGVKTLDDADVLRLPDRYTRVPL